MLFEAIVRGTAESTWLSQGALLWNPVPVVGRVMLSTDYRAVANTMVFEKLSIWMILEFHMNNWGWPTLAVTEHLCFTFSLSVLAFHLNQKSCGLHPWHISLGIATRYEVRGEVDEAKEIHVFSFGISCQAVPQVIFNSVPVCENPTVLCPCSHLLSNFLRFSKQVWNCI